MSGEAGRVADGVDEDRKGITPSTTLLLRSQTLTERSFGRHAASFSPTGKKASGEAPPGRSFHRLQSDVCQSSTLPSAPGAASNLPSREKQTAVIPARECPGRLFTTVPLGIFQMTTTPSSAELASIVPS